MPQTEQILSLARSMLDQVPTSKEEVSSLQDEDKRDQVNAETKTEKFLSATSISTSTTMEKGVTQHYQSTS